MDLLTEILIIIIILILLNPLVEIISSIWILAMELCRCESVDLREKFGEWAVVTGSTDGIGKEYAKELARRNLNIVLISRSIDKLNATKNEICTINPNVQVKVIQADFSKGENEFKTIEDQLNGIPIGILVNNVGKMTDYPMFFEEIPKKILWDIININIGATTLMTRIAMDEMKKRGKGAIVNISSASSFQPTPLITTYAATKVYINFLSDAIRTESSKSGLTIQCLTPFFITTKMTDFTHRFKNKNFLWPDAEKYAKSAIKTLGISNSTTGYWVHDVLKFFTLLSPKWLSSTISLRVGLFLRNDYFKAQKEKNFQ